MRTASSSAQSFASLLDRALRERRGALLDRDLVDRPDPRQPRLERKLEAARECGRLRHAWSVVPSLRTPVLALVALGVAALFALNVVNSGRRHRSARLGRGRGRRPRGGRRVRAAPRAPARVRRATHGRPARTAADRSQPGSRCSSSARHRPSSSSSCCPSSPACWRPRSRSPRCGAPSELRSRAAPASPRRGASAACTLTCSSRKTCRPSSASISGRARVPISLDHLPRLAHEDLLLRLGLDEDRRAHDLLAELLDLDRDRVRHLLARQLQRLLAHELGDLRLDREVGPLLGREVQRPLGQQPDELVAQLVDAVAGLAR